VLDLPRDGLEYRLGLRKALEHVAHITVKPGQLGESATGDMRYAVDVARVDSLEDGARVYLGRGEHLLPPLLHLKRLTGERVPVRVEPRAFQPDHHVPFLYLVPQHKLLHPADDREGQVEWALAVLYYFGYDRRLAAHYRAGALLGSPDEPLHQLVNKFVVLSRERNVINSNERLCPDAEYVVDRHRDRVYPDGVVLFHLLCYYELGPHAVCVYHHL